MVQRVKPEETAFATPPIIPEEVATNEFETLCIDIVCYFLVNV